VKRIILLLCTIALLVPLALAEQQRDKLPAPTNFGIAGHYAHWDAVDDARHYELRWRSTHIEPWTQAQVGANETKYLLDDVPLNHEHRFQIRAYSKYQVLTDWTPTLIASLPVPPPEIPRLTLSFEDGALHWNETMRTEHPFYHVSFKGCGGQPLGGDLVEERTYSNFSFVDSDQIVHVLQVRAHSSGDVYTADSDWSAPVILCAEDLVQPPTPTPSPTSTPYPEGYETPVPPTVEPTETPETPLFECESYVSNVETEITIEEDDGECTRTITDTIAYANTCPDEERPNDYRIHTSTVECNLTPPTGLRVVNDVAMWDAHASAAGYKLRWKQGDSEWAEIEVPITETTYSLDALPRNVDSSLQIQALPFEGSKVQSISDWSESVEFVSPLLELGVPDRIRFDRATQTVRWREVKGATSYTLSVFNCKSRSVDRLLEVPSYLLDDAPQSIYRVAQVLEIVEHGHLGPSSRALIFCNNDDPAVLPIPTNFQVTPRYKGFSWKVTPVEGATGYVVGFRREVASDGQSRAQAGDADLADSTEQPYTEFLYSSPAGSVINLQANTEYAVRIRATSETRLSADTAFMLFTTLASAPPRDRPDDGDDDDDDDDDDGGSSPNPKPPPRPQPQPTPRPTEPPPVTCSPRGSPWVQTWTERRGSNGCQVRRCSVELQQYECTDGRRYNRRLGSPTCGGWEIDRQQPICNY